MIIIPEPPESVAENHGSSTPKRDRSTTQTVWGVILIGIGLIVLLQQFHIFRFFSARFWHVSWGVIFPIFIILIGILILFRRQESRKNTSNVSDSDVGEEGSKSNITGGTIVRPKRDRKLAGVCSGLAYYLEIDPTIVRLLWVIGVFATGGVAVLLYIILAIVLPEDSFEEFDDTASAQASSSPGDKGNT
ncbi:MAG: PspC domain-containing protein [Candidatus Marinimicrobia bacterium]|nr:PspC domain-containing protein [Candidatus Neomarinimicrobiota bacterium]MCF7828144.1 PspC domain-containing protein [Candidatus Neomarinimicrobiota bacterium]MCF7879681.1 PspC domain-containing protein [Candidatus Neomarinimicrobiota bacterium]